MDWGGQSNINNALIYNGFDLVQWYRRLGLTFLFDLDLPLHDRISIGAGLLIHDFSGLVALLIYCALNMIVLVFKTKLIDKPIWSVLALCLITLGLIHFWYMAELNQEWWQDNLHNLLQGYWLALLGLISSIVLEISYARSKRTR